MSKILEKILMKSSNQFLIIFRIYGDKIEDVCIIKQKIFQSITSKFYFVIFSIKDFKDIDEFTID